MMTEFNRLHRYRRSKAMRQFSAENTLSARDFILPLFINESLKQPQSISSLPGISQHTLDTVLQECEKAIKAGIPSVILFGIPSKKDAKASAAYSKKGIIQKAIKLIKEAFPELIVIADCCLCEYTDHGHCGILTQKKLDNDKTLESLQKIALSYAQEGVDIIAPSGMMDGGVQAIRRALDSEGHQTSIMAYAAKYASAFYGPFRDATGCDNFSINRDHHQMQVSQRFEAIREAQIDEEEGADFLIIKPASHYLDIVRDLREETLLPLVAYHVSGEYAMIKAAGKAGLLDEQQAFLEIYTSIKRAGASKIISYAAVDVVKGLKS